MLLAGNHFLVIVTNVKTLHHAHISAFPYTHSALSLLRSHDFNRLWKKGRVAAWWPVQTSPTFIPMSAIGLSLPAIVFLRQPSLRETINSMQDANERISQTFSYQWVEINCWLIVSSLFRCVALWPWDRTPNAPCSELQSCHIIVNWIITQQDQWT